MPWHLWALPSWLGIPRTSPNIPQRQASSGHLFQTLPHVPTASPGPPTLSYLLPIKWRELSLSNLGGSFEPQESGALVNPSLVLDTTSRGLCTLPSSLGCCFSCLSTPPPGPRHSPKMGATSFLFSLVSLRADKERECVGRGSGDEDRTPETPIGEKYS